MTGGEFRVANACNVHATLSTKLPAFLLYELTRSIPRDVLEKGSGTGQGAGFAAEQRRNGRMLALRVLRNCFPIFHVSNEVHSGDTHMRFRYMRYWIGSGHAKAQLPQSPGTAFPSSTSATRSTPATPTCVSVTCATGSV